MMMPFDYNYQNPLGCACLILIRSIGIFVPLGIKNLKEKKTKLDYGSCSQMTPS